MISRAGKVRVAQLGFPEKDSSARVRTVTRTLAVYLRNGFILSGTLRASVVASYLGQGWRAVIALTFIPLYIKYLGIEAYGLIGIFALLQAWLVLIDMGMRPALGREMARFVGGGHDAQSIRDLLRTVEVIAVVVASVVAVALWAASSWLASNWLRPQGISADVAAEVFAIMGAVTALQFIESVYLSSIIGLQRQVLQNTITVIMATVRAVGAIAVLAWVSPTVQAFFFWQGLISLVTVALLAIAVYRILPRCTKAAEFSLSALWGIWKFSAGIAAITLLSLLLTQVDKILLTRLLTLEEFAYYALAAVMSNALYMLLSPILTASYPRFTELATRGDQAPLAAVYHQSAQLVTVVVGAAATVMIVFSDKLVRLWTGDPFLVQQVAPLLTVLTIGTLLNGLLAIPYHLQLAHGWTTLEIKLDIIAVAILVPSVIWCVLKYGPIAAAWSWVALNTVILTIAIPLMHRRLLTTEKWHWASQDVAVPLAGAMSTGMLCRSLAPNNLGGFGDACVLVTSSGCTLLAAALLAPVVRNELGRLGLAIIPRPARIE